MSVLVIELLVSKGKGRSTVAVASWSIVLDVLQMALVCRDGQAKMLSCLPDSAS